MSEREAADRIWAGYYARVRGAYRVCAEAGDTDAAVAKRDAAVDRFHADLETDLTDLYRRG